MVVVVSRHANGQCAQDETEARVSQKGCITLLFTTSFVLFQTFFANVFLPRCIECRRDLAMRILSVCLSVCQI